MTKAETIQHILRQLRTQSNREIISSFYGNRTDNRSTTIKNILNSRQENSKINTNYIGYNVALFDSSVVAPLILNKEIIQKVNERFLQIPEERQRALEIFNWMQGEITYGDTKRGEVGYRNSVETLERKEGVCGEMAYLYVITARASGLKSKYVSVRTDYAGNGVIHGCAGVYLPQLVMVDPAYHMFDVKHQGIEVLDDIKMIEKFKCWREKT